jgi:trk system potassium uptake protein TrkH
MHRRLSWLLRLALLANLTGALMVILGIAIVPSALLASYDVSLDARGQWWAAGISAGVGAVLWLFTRVWARGIHVGHREGFLIVGVGWLVGGLVGALPFWLYAHLSPSDICGVAAALPAGAQLPIGVEFCSFTNAAFESISGFTTTGASIINDGLWDTYGLTADGRAGLPRGILLWRSMTHFLGGMGIVVLSVAILPLLGVGGMQLLKAEVPGPTTDKLAPRVGETARLLWKVYLLFSLVLFVLLAAGGMDAFESVCHTMATMATGGFSTRAGSAGGFHSPYVEWVLTLFMFFAGINFTLHFAARRGDLRAYWRDPEFKGYVALLVVAIGAITAALMFADQGFAFWDSLRISAFQVLSLVTTTGYASFDFETWSYAPVALLAVVVLMFSGGMAGSTGGGVKIVRHVLMVKLWVRELFLLSHPRAKRPIRLGGKAVPPDVLRAVAAFMGAYLFLVLVGTAYFALEGQDAITAFTCAASSLGNVGPGLGDVGPYDNYSVLTPLGKWVSATLMIMGRLEIYTILVLLTPSFWRR